MGKTRDGYRVRGTLAAALFVTSALSLHCGKTSHAGSDPSVKPSSGGSGGSGSGGSNTISNSSGGSNSATGSTGDGNSGEAGAQAGVGATGGSGGAPVTANANTCETLKNDNDQTTCEPMLRAVVYHYERLDPNFDSPLTRSLRTFEYDGERRLLSVGDERPHSDFYGVRYEYDDAGRTTLFESYCDASHFCGEVEEYAYFEDGSLKRADRLTGPRGARRQRSNVYNAAGQLVEHWGYLQGAVDDLKRYSYTDDGLLESETVFDVDAQGNETVQEITRSSYTSDGQLESVATFNVDADGIENLFQETTNTYDENVQLLLQEYRDGEGTLFREVVYTYNEDGQLVLTTTNDYLDPYDEASTTSYTYDASGALASIRHSYPDMDDGTWTEIYEAGRLVAVHRSSFYFSSDTFYDDFGNIAFYISWTDSDDDWLISGSIGHAYSWSSQAVTPNVALYSEYASALPPIEPLQFTSSEFPDFTLTNQFGASSEPYTIANRYFFDNEDRVERIQYDYWPGHSPLEVEVLRCEGAVVEMVRFPQSQERYTVATYYYGCDDFALPDLE